MSSRGLRHWTRPWYYWCSLDIELQGFRVLDETLVLLGSYLTVKSIGLGCGCYPGTVGHSFDSEFQMIQRWAPSDTAKRYPVF
ncbi:hypothetical protein DEO72_LG4g1579 [Vigna unguiculata]|uniref:Uncharacterized protein n=1 Tax=Vigna unguiculata TaxID=3917 RepID=A0A4D6LNX4_VIGUN|nr:hypothetical protein DEO72_LG4g1578 [Vigna unguiculata]QCD90622.1 hypothetical protein DEO72_LG4g1579 [Vigna unguiculata]